MAFPVLAETLNMFLESFNELRRCAIVSIRSKLSTQLNRHLDAMREILEAFQQTQSCPTQNDSLCEMIQALNGECIPHLTKCFSTIYDPSNPSPNLDHNPSQSEHHRTSQLLEYEKK